MKLTWICASAAALLVAGTSATAIAQTCGNGVVEGAEQCDDRNNRDGDGCSGVCDVEANFTCDVVNALDSLNPGFEDPVDASNWAVVAGDIDRLGTSACFPAGEGVFSIDLNGFTQGVIAQEFATVAGQRYVVQYLTSTNCVEVSGQSCTQSCQKELTVGVADNLGTSLKDSIDRFTTSSQQRPSVGAVALTDWAQDSFAFEAAGTSTVLFFSGSAPSAAGPMLDDIVIPESACRLSTCGNGALDAGEACDDGANESGDGCTWDCRAIETGYTCPTPGSPCLGTCGDGVVQGGEDCDDGGTDPDDGCSAICEEEPGFTCEVIPPATESLCCPAGFEIVDGACADIDECATDNGGCGDDGSCENSDGGFACICDDGYEWPGAGSPCEDIDECATDNGGCDANAACENTAGDRTCECDDGYEGDGVTCADIDECATDNGGCDVNATCDNIEGGRECTCDEGYEGDGEDCSEGGGDGDGDGGGDGDGDDDSSDDGGSGSSGPTCNSTVADGWHTSWPSGIVFVLFAAVLWRLRRRDEIEPK